MQFYFVVLCAIEAGEDTVEVVHRQSDEESQVKNLRPLRGRGGTDQNVSVQKTLKIQKIDCRRPLICTKSQICGVRVILSFRIGSVGRSVDEKSEK